MPLILVYNPVCGSGSAKKLVDNDILPLLQEQGLSTQKVIATEYPGHAGIIVVDYLKECSPGRVDLNVIIVSGDGTVHEIVNYLGSQSPSDALPNISFVLVPAGTANALYSTLFVPQSKDHLSTIDYKLQSLRFYIDRRAPKPLTLSITNMFAGSDARKPTVAFSAVVTSTSLHASILHDSEELRKETPGIERFKVAAQQNSKRWYQASAKLLPCPSLGAVQRYDPRLGQFMDHPDSKPENPVIGLTGPFFYFLSTVNVDRLEPEFRITPLVRSIPPPEATCDLVIVRPMRDPSNVLDDNLARERYAGKIWRVLGGAYSDGSHINLRYDTNGEITAEGDGACVVEYFRCGGWEWIPDQVDVAAHLLCSDGTIFEVEKGGRVLSKAVTTNGRAIFTVYG